MADPIPSLAEVYRRGAYAPYTCAARLDIGAGLALVRFAQPAGEFPDPPTADFTLAVNERGAGCMWLDLGAGRRDLAFVPGQLVLKPPSVPTSFGADRPHQKSFVSMPAAMVDGILAECGATRRNLEPLHEGAFDAPAAARILDLMWSEAEPGTVHGRLFADGAVLALLGVLLRVGAREQPPPRGGGRGAISPARVARVHDWIMAHLAEPFGLAEMAAVACLSPYHFSRSFKAATGVSPRSFVQACRIAHARRMLAETQMPLSAIAQACGFADQSHLTAAFVRAEGTTPGRFRRARR